MSLILLAIYTALLLIRPMDWWEPILGWEIVTLAAIASIMVALPQILGEGERLWRTIPEIKMGAAWVLGASASWIPAAWLGGVNMVFQELGKLVIYWFLIVLLCRTPKGYRIILWSVLLCALWMAIHAILQHERGYGFGNQPPLWRVRDRETGEGVWQSKAFGTFEDPNDLCLIFIISIPLFYAEFRSAASPAMKALALIGIPVVGYGVLLTNSRGGYLGVFAMLAAFVIGRLKGFKRWAALAISITFLTLVAPSRFAAGFVGQQDRSILWGDGIGMFKANPFFGVGWSMFQSHQDEHKVAHNTYVHILAETGIIGYLPFFLLLYFAFVHVRRTINLGSLLAKPDSIQLAGLFSACVGYFTSIYFLTRQSTHMPYIMIGLMTVKAVEVCRTPDLVARVFIRSAKEYRTAVIYGVASVAFMWVTIRIVNAVG